MGPAETLPGGRSLEEALRAMKALSCLEQKEERRENLACHVGGQKDELWPMERAGAFEDTAESPAQP